MNNNTAPVLPEEVYFGWPCAGAPVGRGRPRPPARSVCCGAANRRCYQRSLSCYQGDYPGSGVSCKCLLFSNRTRPGWGRAEPGWGRREPRV